MFNKFKKYEYHWIQKFTSNTNLRKQDFLSEEKISDHSCFENKNVLQTWFYLIVYFLFFILWHHIRGYVDLFFQLNLLPSYSLRSQGENISKIFK